MKTIQELTTLLEELEKRLNTVTTAQSTLSQLTAINQYIQDVKEYLEQLNSIFDNHVQNCTDFSDDIATIKNQISTINSTLENISNVSQDQIDEISNNLSTLSNKLDQFLGASTTSLTTLENDICAIQTDLGSVQDDISDINTEITDINTSIGEQNTTITNLQTTQTNLSTTQTNQASTISNSANQIETLKTRMTNCETNISTLTGGVDLSAIDNRISALEMSSGPTSAHQHIDFHNANPSNHSVWIKNISFYCKKNQNLNQFFVIKYSSSGSGTLSVCLSTFGSIYQIFKIDLSKNPNECCISKSFFATKMANSIQIKLECLSEITYKSLDVWMFGTNININNYNQDLKVVVFDHCIYLTKYEQDCIKYGKFSSVSDIDLSNLPNTLNYNTSNFIARYAHFAPYLSIHTSTRIPTVVADYSFYIEDASLNMAMCVDVTDTSYPIKTYRYDSYPTNEHGR